MPEMTRDYYVQRASEARAFASQATDPGEQQIYEKMAANYEQLAELNGGSASGTPGSISAG